jgi:PAS domain S-box-containing protein
MMSLLIPRAVAAQQPSIKFGHIFFEDERWQGRVYDIVQDELGFMWFGARDGLYRYDGYTLTAYRHDPNVPSSLSDNRVRALHLDRTGVLWVGTMGGGLNRFVAETGQFIHYRHNEGDPHSLSHNEVRVIFEDRAGTLWIGTQGGGLNQFDPETEQFIRYQPQASDPHSLSGYNINVIIEDQAGDLWIGTEEGGVNRFDRESQTFTHYQHDTSAPHSLGDNEVLTILEDQAGTLWVGTRKGGLNRFDQASGQFTTYRYDANDPHSLSSATNGVYTLYEDRHGTLWVGTLTGGVNRFDRERELFIRYPATDGESMYTIHEDQTGELWMGGLKQGLYRYDRTQDRFINHQPDEGDPHSLSYPLVWTIYEDRAGGLWFGTWGGVDSYHRVTAQFAHYTADPGQPHSLSHKDIQAVYQDRTGTVWIGTKDGLNRWARDTGQFFHYHHNDADPQSLSGNYITAIYEDRAGTLWVGTLQHGLNAFDPETGHAVHYRYNKDDAHSLSYDYVKVLYEDREGVLWVGTQQGLNRFERTTGQFVRYQHDPEDPHSLSYDNVLVLYEDQDGVLWVGTYRGLNRFDRQTERFIRYQATPGTTGGLTNDAILNLYEDQEGYFWIGTDGGGLHRFDRETETFIHYRGSDGLPSDVVYGILEDTTGRLWLSTSRGLSMFDPQTEIFKNYDEHYGLQGNKFNARAFTKLQSGAMIFGGSEGFNVFDPQAIQDNPYVPPVVLTDFQLFNKSVTPMPEEETAPLQSVVAYADAVALSYKDYTFSFEFAALNYALPEKNEYAYQLEGFDKDWNYIGTRRNAYFTNVPPGEYMFRVKGSNNDGVWNEEGTAITVTITPPWWGTLGFRLAAALLGIGAVFGVVYWRIHDIAQRNRMLEAEVKDRTQILVAKNEALTQANAQLAQSEERFATVMNSMEALMYVADMATHEILFVNQYTREIFGDVEGQICWQVFQTDQTGPCPFCTNAQLVKDGEAAGVYTWEFQNTVTGRWYHIQDRAIRWLDGRLVRLEIATDITERKRAEEALEHYAAELRRSNEELQNFASIVSHDLRAPLRMVKGFLELLKRRYGGQLDEEADEYIHFAVDGAERMNGLIEALLAYARIDTDGKTLVPTDCEAVLERVLGYLHFSIEETAAEVTHTPLPTVLGNQAQITQLFQNLIANALKFHREDTAPRVHISAQAEDEPMWRFAVRDNGIGIPQEQQARIFGIFQRLHTSEEYEGTGIGLATCKKIVERHGGRIWVESAAGEGATFYFTLPGV